MKKTKEESRQRIHFRIRKKVQGSTERPRLTVFRSNKGIYAQLVDDTTGNVVTAASTLLLDNASGNKVEQAKAVGKLIAEKAKDKKLVLSIAREIQYEVQKDLNKLISERKSVFTGWDSKV